jgi:D-alanine--poly(phosphoribitol) ligase subunit 1
LLPQGAWAYAAMFGTMMAGGVYAPINLDHPPERRRHVLSRFEPDAMIAMTESELPDHDRSNDCLDIPIETLGLDALWQPAPAGDLAYVMFTSGSTGEPKGVMISRSALAHYVDWAHREMAVTSEDRWSQHPNIAFDLSVLDIFGALCAGASLYPLTQRKERLFPASAIREHRLSIWNSVPSVVDLMRRTGQLDADHLGSL